MPETDWQATALAYAERIHLMERIAIADQQSYRELQVENENLKHRLSMAESNNPDSVLSKHNAMLMACESRDKLKRELEGARADLLQRIEHHHDALERAEKAESERDTARAWTEDKERLLVNEERERMALQAKVARAVALLKMVETDQTDAPHMQECISGALEALARRRR